MVVLLVNNLNDKKLKIKSKIHNYDVLFENNLGSILKKIPDDSIFW